jgi:hypothetical protein
LETELVEKKKQERREKQKLRQRRYRELMREKKRDEDYEGESGGEWRGEGMEEVEGRGGGEGRQEGEGGPGEGGPRALDQVRGGGPRGPLRVSEGGTRGEGGPRVPDGGPRGGMEGPEGGRREGQGEGRGTRGWVVPREERGMGEGGWRGEEQVRCSFDWSVEVGEATGETWTQGRTTGMEAEGRTERERKGGREWRSMVPLDLLDQRRQEGGRSKVVGSPRREEGGRDWSNAGGGESKEWNGSMEEGIFLLPLPTPSFSHLPPLTPNPYTLSLLPLFPSLSIPNK